MEGITYPISANSGVILIQEQLPNQVSISGSSESSRLEAGKLLSRILSASSWSYSFDLEEELCNSIPIEMREEEMELQRLQMVIEDQKKAKSIQLEIAEASRRKREEEIRMQEEREFKLLEQEKERIRLLEEAREKEIAASRRQKIFAGLSPDQVEALNEFQAISGAELEVCSCYLVHHQWDKIVSGQLSSIRTANFL